MATIKKGANAPTHVIGFSQVAKDLAALMYPHPDDRNHQVMEQVTRRTLDMTKSLSAESRAKVAAMPKSSKPLITSLIK